MIQGKQLQIEYLDVTNVKCFWWFGSNMSCLDIAEKVSNFFLTFGNVLGSKYLCTLKLKTLARL